MALRAIPIRRAGNRHNLFLGGDRDAVMFVGLLSFALVATSLELKATLFGLGLWFVSLYVARKLANADPMMRQVYKRHRKYKKYYPARATPFRSNTRLPGGQSK